jgi:hypothetical protein
MTETNLRDLQAALSRKTGFEMIEHNEGVGQLRVMGRQPKDRMGMNIANWLLVVRSLLQRSGQAGSPWKVDVSKQHFLRGEQVIYAWRLIFQCDGAIKGHYDDIIKTLRSAPHTSKGEITEMPLPGASKNRNNGGGIGKGRGASGTPG